MTQSIPRPTYPNLAADILASLKREPSRSINALAVELAVSTNSVRSRVLDLLENGQLTFVEVVGEISRARVKLWSVAESAIDVAAPKRGTALDAHQITRKTYPKESRRDALVTALFGPAKETA